MEDLKQIFSTLDQLLASTDVSELNADSQIYEELKDGYYLSEVQSAELKSSKAGKPMVAFRFKTVDLGYDVVISETGDVLLNDIPNTRGRTIFMNFVLTDESSIKRFVTNMLKFEGEEKGEPLLPKEAFTTSEILSESLEVLVGSRIYIQVSTSIKDDGTKSTWNNLISWKRAEMLELPM